MIWLQVCTLIIHKCLTTQCHDWPIWFKYSRHLLVDVVKTQHFAMCHVASVNPLQYLNLLLLGNYTESCMGKKLKDRPKIANPLLSNSRVPFMEKLQEKIIESRWGRQIAELLWSWAILNTSLKMNSPLLQLWEVFLSLQIKQHKPCICTLTNESNKSFSFTTAREGATEESLDWARISKWWEFHKTCKSTVRLICFGFTNKLPDGAYTWLGNYLFPL